MTDRCRPPVHSRWRSSGSSCPRSTYCGTTNRSIVFELVDELARRRVALHERDDRAVAAGPPPQRRHEMRIGQAAHVEHQIGVDRHAVLEAEAQHRDDQRRARDRPRDSPMKKCRSSCTVMSDVSTISSASSRIVVDAARAPRGCPRSTDRSGASGCGRRVSLNRRTSVACVGLEEDQRPVEAAHLAQLARRSCGNCDRKSALADVDDDRDLLDVAAARATASPASGSASSAGCRRRSSPDPRARGSPATCPIRTVR